MDTRRAASLRVFFCVSAMVLAGSLAKSLYHATVRICKRKIDFHAGGINESTAPQVRLKPFWGALFLWNLVYFVGSWYNGGAALLQSGNREEVSALKILTDFLLAVGASIVGCYASKWLDGWRKGR